MVVWSLLHRRGAKRSRSLDGLPAARNRRSSRSLRSTAAVGAGLAVVMFLASVASADTWIYEPSISVDQRFDDNYRLETGVERQVSATRIVGDLGISREARSASFTGGVRLDGLLTQGEFDGEELDSNQIVFLESSLLDQRSTWSLDFEYKRDTPSRDIAADLSDADSVAEDSGVVTQRSNVARQRFELAPSIVHELSRRATLDTRFTFTGVSHALPDPGDAFYTRYLQLYNNPNRAESFPVAADGSPLERSDEEGVAEAVGVFTPNGELDDYLEAKASIAWRYKTSPIATVSLTAGASYYVADVEAQDVEFNQLDREGQLNIYRLPRGRDSISTTATLRAGYERSLTPTLRAGIEGGLYFNTTDETDTYRPTDRPNQQFDEERLESLESNENGWLAKVTLNRDAGLTRYAASFGVDVEPSSIGTQVEVQELILDANRTLTPLLSTSLRVRAYEPDRLGANPEDRFARRFLSIEPKIVYQFTREWTGAASYRYRRQKSRVETESGESNALLFSVRYTPASALRDAAQRR